MRALWEVLPNPWRRALELEPADVLDTLEEIRLRVGRPVMLYGGFGRRPLPVSPPPSAEALADLVMKMAHHSLYAREDELRQGYLSLPGGMRVGLAGKAVWHEGRMVTIRDISGVNLRVARAVEGGAEGLIARLGDSRPRSLLIISPPRAGKTTLIRELARIWSDGGAITVVVDERGELAAMTEGAPGFPIGLHTDVLDGWEKPAGILAAVRSLAPELIVVDELGGDGDAGAVHFARRSGVAVVASAHAEDLGDLRHKPALWEMWQSGTFDVLAVLSRHPRPGTLVDLCWRWPAREERLG